MCHVPRASPTVLVHAAQGIRDKRESGPVSKQPKKQDRAYSAEIPHRGFSPPDYRPQALAALDLAAERRARQHADFEQWLSSDADEQEQEIAQ